MDCGVQDDTLPVADQKALTGDACARLGMTLNGTAIAGNLGFRAEAIESPDDLSTYEGWWVYVPDDLGDQDHGRGPRLVAAAAGPFPS